MAIRHVQPLGPTDCYVFSRGSTGEKTILNKIFPFGSPPNVKISNYKSPTVMVGGMYRYHVMWDVPESPQIVKEEHE